MANYESLKHAINTEKEVIGLLQKLPEKDLRQLMAATGEYAAAVKAQAETEKEKEITKRKELETEARKKEAEEQTKRHAEQLKQQKEQLKLRGDELKKVEQAKAEEQKRLVEFQAEKEREMLEHRLKRERENQADLTKAKLKAKMEFDKLDTERAEREKAALKLQHDLKEHEKEQEKKRAQEMIQYKLQEKAKLQVQMADFDLEQRKKVHAAFFKDETEKALALEEVRARAELQKERLRLQMRESFFTGDSGRERLRNIAMYVSQLRGGGEVGKPHLKG